MAQSSPFVTVATHDLACTALAGGSCGCDPELSTERYVRVCANCGGQLKDRRKAYCSTACRRDTRIRSKNLADRQASEEILAAEP